jgi:hypothetical protein
MKFLPAIILVFAVVLSAEADQKIQMPDFFVPVDLDLENPAASSVETRIALDQAPQAVQHAVKQHAGDAPINLSKQFENGRFVYEAQFTREGLLHKIKIAEDGTLLMRSEPRKPMNSNIRQK